MNIKDQINQAFVEIGNKKGYDKVNINEIIKECNISRTTFYYHFKDIPDVIYCYLEKMIFSIFEEGISNYPDNTEKALVYFVENVAYNFPECRSLINSKWRNYTEDSLYKIWVKIEEKIFDIEQKETPITIDEKTFLTRFIAGGVCHYIVYEEYRTLSVPKFAEQLYTMLSIRYNYMKNRK